MSIAFEREDYEAALRHARLGWNAINAFPATCKTVATRDENGWLDDITNTTILTGAGIGDALEEMGRIDEALAADEANLFSNPQLSHYCPLGPTTRRSKWAMN